MQAQPLTASLNPDAYRRLLTILFANDNPEARVMSPSGVAQPESGAAAPSLCSPAVGTQTVGA